jgi:hypothetical protein
VLGPLEDQGSTSPMLPGDRFVFSVLGLKAQQPWPRKLFSILLLPLPVYTHTSSLCPPPQARLTSCLWKRGICGDPEHFNHGFWAKQVLRRAKITTVRSQGCSAEGQTL